MGESGCRIGESHPNAVLLDAEVDAMRDLHERARWSLRRIARAFEVSLTTAARVCRYEVRAQTPERFKTVHMATEE